MKQPVKPSQAKRIDEPAFGSGSLPNAGGAVAPTPVKNLSKSRLATPRITAAEDRVLRWVARGKTNKEIAEILGISPATVKRHLEKILDKLGLRNRVELAIHGLTPNTCPHHSVSGCALRQFGRAR